MMEFIVFGAGQDQIIIFINGLITAKLGLLQSRNYQDVNFTRNEKKILSEVAFDEKGNILYIKQIKEYPYSMHPIIHKDNSITVKYIPSFDKEKVLEMAYKEREKSLKFLKSVGRI